MNDVRTYAVGFCGGSGIAYGLRLVTALLELGHRVHLAATGASLRVMRHEALLDVDLERPDLKALFPETLRANLFCHDLAAVHRAAHIRP